MSEGGHCHRCGAELVDACPICGKRVDVYSRIVGYLRPTSTWNDGKVREFRERREYLNWKGDHIA